MSFTATQKKQLRVFFAIAFGLPYLMALPMAAVRAAGGDVSLFANAQMFYPAAGAMAALLATNRWNAALPRRFFAGFLALAGLMAAMSLAASFLPRLPWLAAASLVISLGSLVCWGLYIADGRACRAAGGLGLPKGAGRAVAGVAGLFLALYLSRYLALIALAKLADPSVTLAQLGFSTDWVLSAVTLAVLPLNFFLAFTPFLGEEYGWRAFLQPLLQRRLGPRRGVLVLGVLWGVWHLPLNVLYYSPDTWVKSLVSQIFLCVALAAFFGYAQCRTRTVWTAVLLHFLNNNLIPVFTGSADLGGQVLTWGSVALNAVLLGALYLPSLASRFWRKEPPPCLPLPEAAPAPDTGRAPPGRKPV